VRPVGGQSVGARRVKPTLGALLVRGGAGPPMADIANEQSERRCQSPRADASACSAATSTLSGCHGLGIRGIAAGGAAGARAADEGAARAPVAGISRAPLVMAVHPSIPAKSVPEFMPTISKPASFARSQ
jgi:hypothetical protein